MFQLRAREIFDWSCVPDPLSDSDIKTWIEALLSGKYIQGGEILKSYDGETKEPEYCCLGVAQEVLKLKSNSYLYLIKGKKDYNYLPEDLQVVCGRFNDDLRLSFVEIAEILKISFGIE